MVLPDIARYKTEKIDVGVNSGTSGGTNDGINKIEMRS